MEKCGSLSLGMWFIAHQSLFQTFHKLAKNLRIRQGPELLDNVHEPTWRHQPAFKVWVVMLNCWMSAVSLGSRWCCGSHCKFAFHLLTTFLVFCYFDPCVIVSCVVASCLFCLAKSEEVVDFIFPSLSWSSNSSVGSGFFVLRPG